jgi:putative ABC transport system ATP-binding protein
MPVLKSSHENPADDAGLVLELNGVSRVFSLHSGEFLALDQVDLQVRRGELLVLTGRSGSGKSTLLHLVAGLDRATSGNVRVAGKNITGLNESDLAAFRGAKIGVVFQFFQLLPTLTALENVLLAMDFVDVIPKAQRHARALSLFEQFGVRDQADKLPAALSGGQQQRVAIARALANDPELLVADEPTGNLDSETAEGVFHLLKSLTQLGKTVLLVTHERALPVAADRIIELRDGRILAETLSAGSSAVAACGGVV